jgi:hypothetical protein
MHMRPRLLMPSEVESAFVLWTHITIRPDFSKAFIEKLFPTFGVGQSIYIQTGSLFLQKLMITIVNMKGQVVVRKQLPYVSQWFQLPALAAGTYLVSIESGEQRYQSAFIKQ